MSTNDAREAAFPEDSLNRHARDNGFQDDIVGSAANVRRHDGQQHWSLLFGK